MRTLITIIVAVDYDPCDHDKDENLTTMQDSINSRKHGWAKEIEEWVQDAMDNDTPYEVEDIFVNVIPITNTGILI